MTLESKIDCLVCGHTEQTITVGIEDDMLTCTKCKSTGVVVTDSRGDMYLNDVAYVGKYQEYVARVHARAHWRDA